MKRLTCVQISVRLSDTGKFCVLMCCKTFCHCFNRLSSSTCDMLTLVMSRLKRKSSYFHRSNACTGKITADS